MGRWQIHSNPNLESSRNDQSVGSFCPNRLGLKLVVLAVFLCVCWVPEMSSGQDEQETAPRPNRVKQEPPKPKYTVTDVDLTTKDGFPLKASWYEGNLGKSAGALLMLPDLGRTRKDFDALATFFADNGHCVLVPDLRGHGDSLRDARGEVYAPKKYGPAEGLGIQTDIEACKKFLVQKNDAEVCNIELMAIITGGATTIPTLGWSVMDWSYLPAAVKQGQDVKAVVVLGATRSYQSLQINPLLKLPLLTGAGHPQPLELMFISGDKSKSFRDTKSIYNSWSVSRGRKNEADDWTKHNIYLIVTESAHDGIASVMKHSDFIPDTIFDFLENRVFSRVEEYGHKTRSTGKSPTPPVLIDGAAGDGQAIAPGPGAPIAPGAGPPPGGNAPPAAPPAAPPRKGGGL